MSYDEWEATASEALRRDPAWKVEAFRLGLFAAALAWTDSDRLIGDERSAGIVGQLMRSAGSVSANIAEGYGRRSPKERVRFYEFALGSAGETRAWYVTVGQTMPPADVEHRLANLLSLTRLLLTMIRHERDKPSDWMERNREHCLTCVPATAIVVSSLRSHLSIGASIISHRRVEPPASLVKTKRDRHPEAPVSLRSSRKSKTRA